MDFRPRPRRSFALALLAIFLISAGSTPARAAGVGDYAAPFQSLITTFETVFAQLIAFVDPHQAVPVTITPAASWHASGATASAAAFNSVAAFQTQDPAVPPTIVHANTTSNASPSVKGAVTSNAPSFTASALPPAPQAQLASYVTQTDLTTQLQQLTNKLTTLVYQNVSTPNSIIATGGITNEIAGTSRINQLSGVAITGGTITNAIVNGVSGLTAADIPALAYLSTSGGSLSGALGIGTTSPSDLSALNGAAYLADIAVPPATTNRLYSNSGNLYWAGNLLGGATTGNWSSDGTNVWRAGGNVGIGTTSPFTNFAVNGNGYVSGNLSLGTALSIANGGTGTTTAVGATANLLFLQNGTGATPRSLSNVLQGRINVADYGAMGGNAVSDTAGIQAAINYAASLGGAEVYFDAGKKYLISSPIVLAKGVTLVGTCPVTTGDTSVPYLTCSTLQAAANMSAMITQTDLANSIQSIGIENVAIDGNKSNYTVTNLIAVSAINSKIENNYIVNGTGNCVQWAFATSTSPAWINWIDDNVIGGCASIGLAFYGSDSRIIGNYISGNGPMRSLQRAGPTFFRTMKSISHKTTALSSQTTQH
jgi:Pectate lyase superfamily protein